MKINLHLILIYKGGTTITSTHLREVHRSHPFIIISHRFKQVYKNLNNIHLPSYVPQEYHTMYLFIEQNVTFISINFGCAKLNTHKLSFYCYLQFELNLLRNSKININALRIMGHACIESRIICIYIYISVRYTKYLVTVV